jgi:phage terminase small subunit
MTLTPKQERFVGEYLKDLNATQAAIRAGYSLRFSEVFVPDLGRARRVATAISEAFKDRAERTRVEQDRVVLELARSAFSDMRQIASWGPDGITLKASHELRDDAAATVSVISETVTTTKGGEVRRTRKAKQYDKLKALELLGRHSGSSGTTSKWSQAWTGSRSVSGD